MSPRQTALGRLLQSRREAAGYSRTRIGELVGIKAGTVEGWELGRVAKPPIHDVLRLAHFLDISAEDVEAAVFQDAPPLSTEGELAPVDGGTRGPGRRRQGAVPLLEAAFRLFAWRDDREAAEALNATADQVSRWRSGAERMQFANFLTLTSMIGMAAAEAMRADGARLARTGESPASSGGVA
jgi:transcriptional regulator with XRE-family HTH domain